MANYIDGTIVRPGESFSFNESVGPRTPERGFREGQMIVGSLLLPAIGGGVCQTATTLFNNAFELGLPIVERHNHSFYISHYPLGRDATVNYPDLDLKFTNDTDNWLLVRTFVGSGSLTVNLYGTPQNRRVESTEEPLRVIGAPRVKRVPDPTLLKGESEVLEYGEPARATSVSRKVYSASGTLLHEDTWYSQYRSEPRVIRVGTKPKPKPKKKPPKIDPLVPAEADGVANAPPASTPQP
jgi:vancomycin resistance protein YoaR